MEVVEKSDQKIVLRIDANETLANTIRRSVSEVPVLAIDEVELYKNDSALYDEMVAHRLGLVPLKTEKGMNAKTSVEFKLSKSGPCTVYSGDLSGSGDVVFEKIPITILGEGHKLELVAVARLGKGIEHAKYVPGLCHYRHILEVKSSPEIDKLVQSSKGLIKAEKKSGKWLCDLDESSEKDIETIDKTAVSNSNEILLVIESYGNMTAKEILDKAVAALGDNLDEFEKTIK